jgi:hypothetical protein
LALNLDGRPLSLVDFDAGEIRFADFEDWVVFNRLQAEPRIIQRCRDSSIVCEPGLPSIGAFLNDVTANRRVIRISRRLKQFNGYESDRTRCHGYSI